MKIKDMHMRLLVGVLLCGALPASAALETQILDYGSAADPLTIGSADFPAQLSFQKFDTSLGSLSDIVITITSQDILQSAVVNLGAATSFQNAQSSATITVTGSDGTQTSDALATVPFSSPIGAGSFSDATQVLGPAVQGSDSASSMVSAADFSAYEWDGTGSESLVYGLTASSPGISSGFGNPLTYFGLAAYSYGQAEIDYYYNSVSAPEPGTLAAGISALGFCAMAMARAHGKKTGRQ
jgi:hypothetical protein